MCGRRQLGGLSTLARASANKTINQTAIKSRPSPSAAGQQRRLEQLPRAAQSGAQKVAPHWAPALARRHTVHCAQCAITSVRCAQSLCAAYCIQYTVYSIDCTALHTVSALCTVQSTDCVHCAQSLLCTCACLPARRRPIPSQRVSFCRSSGAQSAPHTATRPAPRRPKIHWSERARHWARLSASASVCQVHLGRLGGGPNESSTSTWPPLARPIPSPQIPRTDFGQPHAQVRSVHASRAAPKAKHEPMGRQTQTQTPAQLDAKVECLGGKWPASWAKSQL